MPIHQQIEIVFVRPVESVSHDLFAHTTFAQERAERPAVGVAFVGDVHCLGRCVA